RRRRRRGGGPGGGRRSPDLPARAGQRPARPSREPQVPGGGQGGVGHRERPSDPEPQDPPERHRGPVPEPGGRLVPDPHAGALGGVAGRSETVATGPASAFSPGGASGRVRPAWPTSSRVI